MIFEKIAGRFAVLWYEVRHADAGVARDPRLAGVLLGGGLLT
ncbi:hypothetical protein [Amycolatopsis plumensis]|uniref:Uncharacterized protein n=1 Tax=Amycolatopsis plumensis TaxID=236508 RepID=A0ABV5U0M8_9PSEU